MDGLPKLVWLDISGTNLAGDSHGNDEELVALPWLESRRLDYLGLLNCVTPSDHPCYRQNLPAENVIININTTEIQGLWILTLKRHIHHALNGRHHVQRY